jgi:hypothetical protein
MKPAHCLMLCALGLLLLCSAAAAQPTRTLHLKLLGPIDCLRQAEEFKDELARAKELGVGCVAVELDGRIARGDLVLMMARELRGCGVRSVAMLSSTPGGNVGPGQALIALAADATYIMPRTSIAGTADDLERHRDIAPPETDWGWVRQESVGLIWKQLEGRSADPQLAYVLAEPTDAMWAVRRDEELSLTSSTPAAGEDSTQLVFAGGGGFERLHIDAITALRLRLIAGTAQSATEAAARSGSPTGDRTTRVIRSGLHAARTSTANELRGAPVEVQRIKAHLNVKQRHSGVVITDALYRKAGEEALARIRALEERLAAIDSRLEDYPELLVVQRPPGSRATRPPPDSIAGQLAAVRKDLEKLRVQASEYATRR